MLLIRKDPPSPEVSREINRVKHDVDWDHADLTDPITARNAFDLLDKSIIREQLLKEQKGLCAYCMKKIRNNEKTVIEHWCPIDANPSQALSYTNMLACCDGGRKNDTYPHVLSCDAAKGDQTITISPLNEAHMTRIRYRANGTVSVFPEDAVLAHDINDILKLNGEVDPSGKVIHDTSTNLVHGRRQVYVRFREFMKRVDKMHKSVPAIIRKRIKELTEVEQYGEYVGVELYLLRRRLGEKANSGV